ncbi:MAG TPA: carboxypeptidase-like regulatory domain-containing protein [Candidatus Eremiobacteraceae bacterium]|nr:carboxypeptidase-like regulatory domain-containing protein [Candidatus Eremiobacteraceae bacterium]
MRSGARVVPVLVFLVVTSLSLSVNFLMPAGVTQSATTSIRGEISDAKGLVVSGATVTLSNAATGFSRTTKTDGQGVYQFLEIPPAAYVLTVEAAGFATMKRENVVLQVSSPATLNLTVQVQGRSVVIDVTGEAPMVNTQDATLGNTFNSRQLMDLPAEGRDPASILSLQPGVVYIGSTTTTQQDNDSRGGAVNGARSDQSNITLDGLDDNDQLEGYAFQGAMRATLDSLQEFRVTTSNYDAASGRSSGAQMNLVTKSGTNFIHGSVYEYNRPTFDVANDWFNKQSELEAGLPNIPQHILRNTFGGTVGGPIKKDRLFFFAAFEGQRTAEQQQTTRIVPTASLREGMIKYLCNPSDPNCALGSPNANGVTVQNIAGFAPDYVATLTPAQFASLDNPPTTGCGSQIPPTCPLGPGANPLLADIGGANPNALFMHYPLPNCTACGNAVNGSGDGLNSAGFTFPGNDPIRLDTYIFKLDYKITANGNHSLFVRGNLQNDHQALPPQFPGLPPDDVVTNNSKGIAGGYTYIIRNNLINNFRYAFIRQGLGKNGLNSQNYNTLRGLDDTQALSPTDTPTILTNVPVHNFIDDVSWTKGTHTIQFGTNWRLIHNNRQSNAQNLSSGYANLYWMSPSFISNNGVSLDPALGQNFPLVDVPFEASYDFAATQLAGLMSQVYTVTNQDKNAIPIHNGDLVPRHFHNFEGEMYLQDKWNATPNLTITYGLRYSLLQPPYEADGNQVSPTIDMHQWFENRITNMYQGVVDQPLLSFDLSGQGNGKKPYWAWNYKNVAPRFAIAYAPHADSGFWRTILGDKGKSSIRAGYGIYYDHFGEGVVNTFDRQGSWGLSTTISNPAGVLGVDTTPRYTGLLGTANLPPSGGVPSPHGFPYTPSVDPNTYGLAIAWGIDDNLKTPYSHVVDFSLTRELPHSFVIEATYTGRFAHHLLQEIDLSQPLDLVDPKSHMDYFAASQILSKNAYAGTPESAMAKIPYWEDLFPQAAGSAGASLGAPGTPACVNNPNSTTCPTATQNIYDLYYSNLGNETLSLEDLDAFCFPACAGTGTNTVGGAFVGPLGTPFQYYQPQFSSLYGWQSRGNSNYNGLQISLRHAMAAGLQFDFNYVYSKSIDVGSNAERVNGFESNGLAFNSQVINAFSPDQWRAPSDFDTTQQFNANWVWDLPYGRGRHWGSGAHSFMNAIFGGWGFNGLYRWTSGFPFSVEAGNGWSTDFELEGSSVLTGPKPKTGVFIEANGSPTVFKNPEQTITCSCSPGSAVGVNTFRPTYAGEAGQRNNFRGPGYFGIDAGLSKIWSVGEQKTIRFAWEAFNVTNSVRFDAAGSLIGQDLVNITGFGILNTELTQPRVMQYSLRFSF